MKNISSKIAGFVIGSALLTMGAGCNKADQFGDTNVNPNGTPIAVTSALLTNIENALGANFTANQPGGYMAQYFAEITYPGVTKFQGLNFNTAAGLYSGIMMDAQVIINKNSDPATAGGLVQYGANVNQIAVAKMLKSYIMWTITDRWGDMPYSEALQGVKFTNPKYDRQEDIYKGLLADLTDAVNSINTAAAAAAPLRGDVIYGGDMVKWGKFGNTLRMLMSMRLSKRYPNAGEYAATQFNAALTAPHGYMTTNADNLTMPYPGGNYQNPFFALGTSQDVGVALTFTDIVNGLGDPRANGMFSSPNGAPYGLCIAAPIGGTYARTFAASFRNENSPLVIVNSASSLLALAEAIERGWVPGMTTADAQVAYNQAITNSFAQWGQGAPGAYLTSGPANYNTGTGVASIGGSSVPGSSAITTTKLQRIHLQQFIAFYPDGIQGWSNWRRTGVPNLQPSTCAQNPTLTIPRRHEYGATEYSTNAAQLATAISNLPGGDVHTSRVWWDQ